MKPLSLLVSLLGCLQLVGAARAQTAPQPPTAQPLSAGTTRSSGDHTGPSAAKVRPHAVVIAPANEPDSQESVRARRRFAIAGELGWNSLTGMGIHATFHPIPLLALELGTGLSTTGFKGGVRFRVNLLESAWTPTFGAAFMYGSGSGGKDLKVKVEVKDEEQTLKFRVLGSPYVQVVGGVNYTSRGGFVVMTTVGWAFLLRGHNIKYIDGPKESMEDIEPAFGGGLVIASALGYAF